MSKELPKWVEELPRHARSPSLYIAVSRLLLERGLGAEAREVLNEGFREFPESPDLALARGGLLLDSGRAAEAMEQFGVVAKQIRHYMNAFERMARIFKQRGENERAVLAYKVFLAHKAFMTHAFGRETGGKETGAPDPAPIKTGVIEGTETETMADLYLQQGQLVQAESIYQHLSEKFPENSQYRGKLKEIRTLKEKELEKQKKSLDVMVRILDGIQPRSSS
ncbi:MAG: hypothetical protein HY788_19085 [Deltaproteobacteria bacterium]|nr:hypothetical protein [Deltaproteobacteria bacterium]